MIRLRVANHELLVPAAFVTRFPDVLGRLPVPAWLVAGLGLQAQAPLHREEEVRKAVRNLLRLGGYKPTGRGKPASEYLVRAAGEGKLGSINVAVDACNVTSLHSGLPISVVDLDRAEAPFRLATQPAGETYVFNQSGQEIDLGGLLCLEDKEGACANAVKDSQRTKTTGKTTATLSVLWGMRGYESRLEAASTWYRELLKRAGASTEDVELLSEST